jgi:hypothetical protein
MRAFAFALLALLVLPTTSASPQVSLQATSLEWPPPGTASGPLVALAALGGEPPALSLIATTLTLTWDETPVFAKVPGTGFLSVTPTTQQTQAGPASLTISSGRTGWFAYVLPTGAALAQVDCGSLTPASESLRTVPIMVDRQRPAPTADTSAAIEALNGESCPSPAWRVQGDIQLILWELDGELSTTDGTTAFQSGQPSGTSARQYFIDAHGADLTFTGPGSLYLTGADLDAQAVSLHRTTGTAAGLDASGALVVLRGDRLATHIARDGSSLVVAADHAARLEIDGAAVALDGHGAPLWPWWLLLAAVAVAAVAMVRRHAVNPVHVHRRLQTERQRGRLGRVIGLADRLLERNPNDVPALQARAGAWLHLGDPERALADARLVVERKRGGFQSGEVRAAFAILACRAAARLGRLEDALRFLGDAYVEHPEAASRAAEAYPEVKRLTMNPAGYA